MWAPWIQRWTAAKLHPPRTESGHDAVPPKGDPASISVTKRYLEPLTLGGLIKEVWLDVPTGQTKVCVMVRYR